MIIFYITGIITTAIVSVWATVVASTAVKNQLIQRQLKQLRYWQDRAVQAESQLRPWLRSSSTDGGERS